MQALSEKKPFEPTDLDYFLLDIFTELILNDNNNTTMQKQFYLPVKQTDVPDTHHMVDNYQEPDEFENRSDDYEHEALLVDTNAELQLLEHAEN